MDKVLIFGINGFSGKHFQDYIVRNKLNESWDIIGADKEIDNYCNALRYVKTDLSAYENIEKLMLAEKPAYIINLIGIFHSEDLDFLININANITFKLLDIIVKNKIAIKKLLLVGTAAEYGISDKLPIREDYDLRPVNFYGLSKVVQYEYMLFYKNNHGINLNLARTFNVVGKGLSPYLSISSFVKQCRNAKDGDTIYVGNLSTKRDFLDIDDVVDGYWKILMHGKSGEVYNVCCGESFFIKDILNYLIEKAGKKVTVAVKDEFVKKNDIADSYGDNSKLIKDTGWSVKSDFWKALERMYNS